MRTCCLVKKISINDIYKESQEFYVSLPKYKFYIIIKA